MVFEAFRKRQKEMLAALVLVAMFVFIAGDLPSKIIYGDRGRENFRLGEVWNKARTRVELEQLENDRRAARGALQRMMKSAGEKADADRFFNVYDPTDLPWSGLQNYGISWPLAFFAAEGKADRLGIKVTDDDVTQFIKQITGNALSPESFREALTAPQRVGSRARGEGASISEQDLYRVVAREIKVRKALDALTVMTDRTTPLDYWRHPYEDARALFTLEMVRLPVDKYIDAKTVPSEKELQAIYERYKNTQADPERNVIGFLRPATAEFEYTSVPVEKWLDQVQVSDEECKAYYEKNKLTEFRDELPIEMPKPPAGAIPAPPPAKGAASPNVPGPVAAPAKKQDAPKAEPKKAEPSKSDLKGDSKANTNAKSAPTDKKSSGGPTIDVLGAIAATSLYVQAPDGKKAEPSKPPATNVEASKQPVQDVKKVEPSKNEQKPVAEAGKKKAPPLPQPPNVVGQANAGEGVAPPKIKAYLDVKPQIERKLKMEKAREVVRGKIKALQEGELGKFADNLIFAKRKWQDEHEGKLDGFVPPKPPRSMESVAQELRGDFHRLGPAAETDVSKMPGFGRLSQAIQKLYDPQALPFAAESEPDVDQTTFYVYWRTNYKKEEPAPFDRVKDQATVLWRRQEAQKPAKEAADKLAEKVKKAGFAEANKGTDFRPFQPGEYRRSTYHSSGFQNALKLPFMQRFPNDELQGVPDAKAAFLDEVFEMEVGDVRVLPGATQENYYVVRCVKREEPNFDEFADDYDLLVRPPSKQQERFAQQLYGQVPPSKRALMATAGKVLEESGYSPPARTAGEKGSPTSSGDEESQ